MVFFDDGRYFFTVEQDVSEVVFIFALPNNVSVANRVVNLF
jgi:hypothetical protein